MAKAKVAKFCMQINVSSASLATTDNLLMGVARACDLFFKIVPSVTSLGLLKLGTLNFVC